eukprot:gene26316-32272_t
MWHSFMLYFYLLLFIAWRFTWGSNEMVYLSDYEDANYFAYSGNSSMEVLKMLMADVMHIIWLKRLFFSFTVAAVICNMLRVMEACRCHPRLDLVSATLRAIGNQMMTFLLLMAWIIAMYAMAAHLSLGPTVVWYSEFGKSLVTLGDALIGGGFFYPVSSNGAKFGNLQGFEISLLMLIGYSFNMVLIFVLMTFFFSIIEDGLGGTEEEKEAAEEAESFFGDLLGLQLAKLRDCARYP